MAALIKQTVPLRRGAQQPPRSRAFFLELLLNMLVFALCAVIALQVFAEGKMVTDKSAALSTLTTEAKDLAGHYKVTSGDVSELLTNGVRGSFGTLDDAGVLTYYYDKSFQLTDARDARYWLVLAPVASTTESVSIIEISAHQFGYSSEEILFSFTVVNYKPLAASQELGLDQEIIPGQEAPLAQGQGG